MDPPVRMGVWRLPFYTNPSMGSLFFSVALHITIRHIANAKGKEKFRKFVERVSLEPGFDSKPLKVGTLLGAVDN